MRKTLLVCIIAFVAIIVFACSSESMRNENESLKARLTEVESEYSEYKQLMQEYDELASDELQARKYQAEQQRLYIEAIKESEAIEESKQLEAQERMGYDTGITYSNLNREPDSYKGQKVKFFGRVLQVLEEENEIAVRLATRKFKDSSVLGNLSYMEDEVLGVYNSKTSDYRILEGDMITIYGVSRGLYTYTSTQGEKITLPLIDVQKIDLQEY